MKSTVCILFGGRGAEHNVSLSSAYAVISHMNREKYDILCVGITEAGEWLLYDGEKEKIKDSTWEENGCAPVTVDLTSGDLVVLGEKRQRLHPHVFFPVLHGDFGEDGRLQGLFDIAGVRYVGCGAFSSHLCMDKSLTKRIAKELGVEVADYIVTNTSDVMLLGNKMRYPLFVKPCMGGSSAGAAKVECQDELKRALDTALEFGQGALVEEFIDGYEVEVGVLDTGKGAMVSPVGMIRYEGDFYDYDTKYKSEKNEYLIPAPIDRETERRIKDRARILFAELGCRGLGRFDFFVKNSGEVIFNEVNTMPGFTDKSMFPKLFMSTGMSFGDILDCLIDGAMKREFL